jgi:hypothetical protein
MMQNCRHHRGKEFGAARFQQQTSIGRAHCVLIAVDDISGLILIPAEHNPLMRSFIYFCHFHENNAF